MAVPVVPQDRRSPTLIGESLAHYRVTADGKRRLVVRPGKGATARRMVLVQNWLAEFRRSGGR